MSKRQPSSDELYNEALHRYRECNPLSNPELDALLKWASEKHLDFVSSKRKRRPSETTMLAVRLLLAGRTDALSSPKEGHAEVRMKEIAQSSRV